MNPLPRDNYNNVVENTDTDNRKKEKHDTGNRKTLFSLSVSKDIHNTMKYSFWQHVGMLGFGVILFQLSICGWYIYIIFGYTRFQNFDREWIWLFIVMAILFFVSTVACILMWKKFAMKYSNANMKKKNNANDNNNDQSSDKNNGSCLGVFTYIYGIYYDAFDFNGKYYLWNLYTFDY